MTTHLTDVAFLEWVRKGKTVLAPETASAVETHLSGCAVCRRKLEDFGALERSFHAYGAPMRTPAGLRAGRALVVALVIVVIVLGVAALVR